MLYKEMDWDVGSTHFSVVRSLLSLYVSFPPMNGVPIVLTSKGGREDHISYFTQTLRTGKGSTSASDHFLFLGPELQERVPSL